MVLEHVYFRLHHWQTGRALGPYGEPEVTVRAPLRWRGDLASVPVQLRLPRRKRSLQQLACGVFRELCSS